MQDEEVVDAEEMNLLKENYKLKVQVDLATMCLKRICKNNSFNTVEELTNYLNKVLRVLENVK